MVQETSGRLKASAIVPVLLSKVFLSTQPRLVRATAKLQRKNILSTGDGRVGHAVVAVSPVHSRVVSV